MDKDRERAYLSIHKRLGQLVDEAGRAGIALVCVADTGAAKLHFHYGFGKPSQAGEPFQWLVELARTNGDLDRFGLYLYRWANDVPPRERSQFMRFLTAWANAQRENTVGLGVAAELAALKGRLVACAHVVDALRAYRREVAALVQGGDQAPLRDAAATIERRLADYQEYPDEAVRSERGYGGG